MTEQTSTDSYSDSQKLALYYKELQDSNPAWRPCCPECRQARRGEKLMIKTHTGFECLHCKLRVNKYMKKEDKNDSQITSTVIPRANVPASRTHTGD